MPRRTAVLLVLAAGVLATPSGARAAGWCVENITSSCPDASFDATHQKPTVGAAYAAATGGDTIRVQPGTYNEQITDAKPNLTIFGAPGLARPVISNTSAASYTFWVQSGATGTTLRHLDVRQGDGSSEALRIGTNGAPGAGDITVDDVRVQGAATCMRVYAVLTSSDLELAPQSVASCLIVETGSTASLRRLTGTGYGLVAAAGQTTIDGATLTGTGNGTLVSTTTSSFTMRHARLSNTWTFVSAGVGNATIEDSLMTSAVAGAIGIYAGGTVTVRGSTIVMTGSTSTGVRAAAQFMFGAAGRAAVTNSIVRATSRDLQADPGGVPSCGPGMNMPCLPGVLEADHTNYRPSAGDGVTDKGANQSGDPLFAGPSDFHLQSGSPAIDAGTAVAAGTTDLDGRARPDGAAPDLGAFEFDSPDPPVATEQPPATTPITTTAPPVTTPPPAVKPAVKKCTVPRLKGRTLATARRALKKAGCKLGKVKTTRRAKRLRRAKLVVKRQAVRAGTKVALGRRVGLTLDRTPRPRRRG